MDTAKIPSHTSQDYNLQGASVSNHIVSNLQWSEFKTPRHAAPSSRDCDFVLTSPDTPGQIRPPAHTVPSNQGLSASSSSSSSPSHIPPYPSPPLQPSTMLPLHSLYVQLILTLSTMFQVTNVLGHQRLPPPKDSRCGLHITSEGCPLKYIALGLGQSRKLQFKKSKDHMEVGLLTLLIPTAPNEQTHLSSCELAFIHSWSMHI